MHDKRELCEKIREIYPDIGVCGLEVEVAWDEAQKVWRVDLKKGAHELRTYLEADDADGCMEGTRCVALGLQIAQLKENIEKLSE